MLSNQADAIRQAEQLAEQGNLNAAIAIYRTLIEADPLDLNSVQAIGDLYVRAGRVQEALHELGRLADRWISLGPAINAAPLLKRMLDLDPSNAAVRMKLATVYARAGKSEQALQTYIEAGSTFARKGNLVAALEAIRKALAINPDSPQAQAAYKALGGQPAPTPPLPVAEHPKPPPATPKTTSRLRDTTELAELGQMLSAASAEFAPTDITDEFIVKQLFASELLAGCGDTDKAIASLKRIIQFRPDHVEVRTKLTDIYLRSGKMREASQEFVEIARIYESKGDVARAKDFSVRAQRLMQPREESRPGTSAPQAASPKVNKPHKIEARPGTLPGLSHVADTSLNLVVHTKSLRSGEEVVAPAAIESALAAPAAIDPAVVAPAAIAPAVDSVENEPTAPVVAPPGAVAPIGIVRREAGAANGPTMLGLLDATPAEPVAEAPKKPRRKRIIFYAVAATVVMALLGGWLAGHRLYAAQIDHTYQALAHVNSLPAPSRATTADTYTLPSSEERMDVRGESPSSANAANAASANGDKSPQNEPSETLSPAPPAADPNAEAANRNAAPAPSRGAEPPVVAAAPNVGMNPGGASAELPNSLPRNGGVEPPPPVEARKAVVVIKGESIHRVQPEYPSRAKLTHQSGAVTVEVSISDHGDVISAQAVSGPTMLRESAVTAAQQWKFKPATRDGKPVASASRITFNFKLQ